MSILDKDLADFARTYRGPVLNHHITYTSGVDVCAERAFAHRWAKLTDDEKKAENPYWKTIQERQEEQDLRQRLAELPETIDWTGA